MYHDHTPPRKSTWLELALFPFFFLGYLLALSFIITGVVSAINFILGAPL